MKLRDYMCNSDIPVGDGYTLSNGDISISKRSIVRIGGIDTMVKRLVGVYLDMPERYRLHGASWYQIAHEFAVDLARTYDLDLWAVCQVISAVSPRNSWEPVYTKDGRLWREGNQVCALKIVRAWVEGGESSVKELTGWGYSKSFVGKAIKALKAEEVNWSRSPKTHRFALLIFNPSLEDIAVIDSHASRIATGNLGGKYHKVQEHAYPLIESAYRIAAKLLGITAQELQAALWSCATDGQLY